MEETKTYYGKGNPSMFDEYMDFINYVFGFNGNSSDFKTLLPKLYKPEYDPAGFSYVATEDGKLKAAIGAFDHDIEVCGELIRTRGIGNVAVHPYARSRGYMKTLMNMAVDDMVKEGIALTVLGGNRQRYNYFSYDKAGTLLSLSINSNNMRHVLGTERTHTMIFKRVGADDTEALAQIAGLYARQPLHAVRPVDKLYEIMISWKQTVWAAYEEDNFAGYCVLRDDSVTEIFLETPERVREFVSALYDTVGKKSLYIKLPPFQSEYIDRLCRFCEYYDIEPDKSFSVLDYKLVVGAFLRLKATYLELPDGELTLAIYGRAKNENITLTVRNGVPTVEATDKAPDITLDHLEAMNLLFAPVCPPRDRLPSHARLWLPLPIFIHSSDTV